jgi:hypothetical protein
MRSVIPRKDINVISLQPKPSEKQSHCAAASRLSYNPYVTERLNLTVKLLTPIKVAALYKTRNVLARSESGTVGLSPARGMNMYLRIFCD